VKEPLELTIGSRSGKFAFSFVLDAAAGKPAATRFVYKGLPVDSLTSWLKTEVLSVRGGTLDLVLDANLDLAHPQGVWIDAPLQVHLQGTTLALQGLQPTAIDSLTLPIGLRGPLASPRVSLDDKSLADALVAAGRAELANQVRSRATQLLGDKVPGVGDALGGLVDGTKTTKEVVDEAQKKATDAAAEAARKKAEEEAKKRLPGGLGGLLGGKKDDKK
jgi:hypothetical protein